MRFTLTIELGNEAMQSFQDLRDALKQTAMKLGSRQHCIKGSPSDGDGSKVMDANGNSVGEWKIEPTTAADRASAAWLKYKADAKRMLHCTDEHAAKIADVLTGPPAATQTTPAEQDADYLQACEWCGDDYDPTAQPIQTGYCSQDCIDAHNRDIAASERVKQQAEIDPSSRGLAQAMREDGLI